MDVPERLSFSRGDGACGPLLHSSLRYSALGDTELVNCCLGICGANAPQPGTIQPCASDPVFFRSHREAEPSIGHQPIPGYGLIRLAWQGAADGCDELLERPLPALLQQRGFTFDFWATNCVKPDLTATAATRPHCPSGGRPTSAMLFDITLLLSYFINLVLYVCQG